ncbi:MULTISPECIES: SRPBCC family protein [Rhodopseudomonas]|uniref:Polyketide cyclase n=1 Tax=Rhodopseudomonas palustris TaxID=1076 RepID=A0A0D7DY27_RHOPL|nr:MULTISPECIES: SRPBCC family protein [Rhodopseudomonas]KIZ33105.1 polyketide cyclase [Rhodopseudomonas palustris]MDF3812830.1 SRPBCC family protein [Rhodopseudomonas sp. BAL398]WOK17383.1 SRPBCC family protein [Rhodopseudomonas sp. BAL398]
MLKTISFLVALFALAIAIVLGLALSKPDKFRVERKITINAPPAEILPLINDLHRWRGWSPYETKDLAMTRTYSGAPSGKGAIYQWSGNKYVGSGRMEIIDSTPTRIVLKLDFIAPFESHNICEFTLRPQGDATEVTWSMHGPTPLLSKVMQVFLDMDRMIGDDFAGGLARLKAIAER